MPRQPLACIPGSRDRERPVALSAEHGINQKEGDAATMIAMEMGEQNCVNRIVWDGEAFKSDETRGPEIDAEANAGGVNDDARVEPSPGPKRVTGAYERHTD
jgi:hypothetical protein